mmetsp:Transcript_8077/g.19560  ORF Transcript_8077/g.19560 Transcript_8077/m.19560 type:complete len:155 (-) Transcript_8077:1483-1947(-)
MSVCSRNALRLSRSLSKTRVSSRNFASLGSRGDWCSKPSQDAIISSLTWNTTSASTKIGMKESAEKTNRVLDSILSQSYPLPHAHHMTSMNSDVANLSSSTNMPLSFCYPVEENEAVQVMNRNARRPKKSNKRSRPCSRIARRKKKDAIGKRRR